MRWDLGLLAFVAFAAVSRACAPEVCGGDFTQSIISDIAAQASSAAASDAVSAAHAAASPFPHSTGLVCPASMVKRCDTYGTCECRPVLGFQLPKHSVLEERGFKGKNQTKADCGDNTTHLCDDAHKECRCADNAWIDDYCQQAKQLGVPCKDKSSLTLVGPSQPYPMNRGSHGVGVWHRTPHTSNDADACPENLKCEDVRGDFCWCMPIDASVSGPRKTPKPPSVAAHKAILEPRAAPEFDHGQKSDDLYYPPESHSPKDPHDTEGHWIPVVRWLYQRKWVTQFKDEEFQAPCVKPYWRDRIHEILTGKQAAILDYVVGCAKDEYCAVYEEQPVDLTFLHAKCLCKYDDPQVRTPAVRALQWLATLDESELEPNLFGDYVAPELPAFACIDADTNRTMACSVAHRCRDGWEQLDLQQGTALCKEYKSPWQGYGPAPCTQARQHYSPGLTPCHTQYCELFPEDEYNPHAAVCRATYIRGCPFGLFCHRHKGMCYCSAQKHVNTVQRVLPTWVQTTREIVQQSAPLAQGSAALAAHGNPRPCPRGTHVNAKGDCKIDRDESKGPASADAMSTITADSTIPASSTPVVAVDKRDAPPLAPVFATELRNIHDKVIGFVCQANYYFEQVYVDTRAALCKPVSTPSANASATTWLSPRYTTPHHDKFIHDLHGPLKRAIRPHPDDLAAPALQAVAPVYAAEVRKDDSPLVQGYVCPPGHTVRAYFIDAGVVECTLGTVLSMDSTPVTWVPPDLRRHSKTALAVESSPTGVSDVQKRGNGPYLEWSRTHPSNSSYPEDQCAPGKFYTCSNKCCGCATQPPDTDAYWKAAIDCSSSKSSGIPTLPPPEKRRAGPFIVELVHKHGNMINSTNTTVTHDMPQTSEAPLPLTASDVTPWRTWSHPWDDSYVPVVRGPRYGMSIPPRYLPIRLRAQKRSEPLQQDLQDPAEQETMRRAFAMDILAPKIEALFLRMNNSTRTGANSISSSLHTKRSLSTMLDFMTEIDELWREMQPDPDADIRIYDPSLTPGVVNSTGYSTASDSDGEHDWPVPKLNATTTSESNNTSLPPHKRALFTLLAAELTALNPSTLSASDLTSAATSAYLHQQHLSKRSKKPKKPKKLQKIQNKWAEFEACTYWWAWPDETDGGGIWNYTRPSLDDPREFPVLGNGTEIWDQIWNEIFPDCAKCEHRGWGG